MLTSCCNIRGHTIMVDKKYPGTSTLTQSMVWGQLCGVLTCINMVGRGGNKPGMQCGAHSLRGSPVGASVRKWNPLVAISTTRLKGDTAVTS